MSSGSHLSRELHDLIKSIGETRSKQEEDKIIIKEVNNLKTKLNEKNIPPKKIKEHLIRGIYIEMLGHDASFAHIHAVNLTNSKNLALKRLGYLCCSLFLDSDSELLILLVATLQKDLGSTNVHIVVIALTAVAKLISKSFVSALVEPVLKLLTHNTDIIRKKALMVMQIIRQLNSDCISENEYDDRIRRGIQDKEASVMGTAFNLYHEELKKGNIQKYKSLTPTFVSMLKQIIEHKLHKDYDYHRFPAPWLQIKLLQIISLLGANDQKVSEQIYEILGSTLRRADDTSINIGYAVTYQCVKTIATIYPFQNLLEQAANSVSRFLKSENNNLKYLGINALTQIVSINQKYVLDHQMTIVDCMESSDDTLKKETLELLFKMTNENNYEVIISKLIHFLKTSDDQTFKRDLFSKISVLNERHAPTQEWFIKTANTIFEFGSEFIDNEVRNNFFKLLIDNFSDSGVEFGVFIVEIYLELIRKNDLHDNIMKLISWVLGEMGSLVYDQDCNKLNEITTSILLTLDYNLEDENTISWILSALAKLQSARAFQMFDQTKAIFQKYTYSKQLDCQERAIDFSTLGKYNAALKQSSKINLDPQLSFLDSFVNAEKLKGAPEFNPSLQVKAAALVGAASDGGTLNFEPYKDAKYVSKPAFGPNATVETTQENKAVTGLKVHAPEVWGEEGYNAPQPVQTKALEPKMAMGAMGSGGTNTTQQKTGIQMQGIGSTQLGFDKNPQPQPAPIYVAPQKPKEDPNLKEKQKLANQLFNPVAPSQQQQPQGMKMQRKGIPLNQQQQQQQQQQQAPQQSPNLLEFDDNQKKMPTFAPQQTRTPFQLPQKQQIVQPQPVAGPTFIPAQINLEQYEQLWEKNNNIIELTLKSKIRSENDFKNMIQLLNINIIEIIEQEIISAGANAQNRNVVLVYGLYSKDGSLDLKINAKDPKDGEAIITTIKKNFT